ncbi:hypothetical protein GIB67_029478 [Kingdonia uniflora]|uniref:Uncharacterized protein n=1 Tax=Kingdonia uniflora TaxID=39325 RepID=A0A7J7NY87_9MAGN|nr:hypothetical protein GIB67_029478 [Kingdonia uniflora]
MAKTLISSPPFLTTPSLSQHGSHSLPLFRYPPSRRFSNTATRVNLSFNEIPTMNSVDLQGIVSRAESLLYTLADAAVVAADSTSGTGTGSNEASVQKSGGWFGFISDAMEVVLKVIFVKFRTSNYHKMVRMWIIYLFCWLQVLKDGLSAVHVPYAYGFAIILLTVIVKVATLPLTKQQVNLLTATMN